jgi:hypothetical protein
MTQALGWIVSTALAVLLLVGTYVWAHRNGEMQELRRAVVYSQSDIERLNRELGACKGPLRR